MNLKNIARDATWLLGLSSAGVGWSTSAGLANSNGTVHEEVATVFSTGASSGAATQTVGCYLSQTPGDNQPYRVKAHVPVNDNMYIVLGYAPATITGTDDAIVGYKYVHLVGEMDDIFMFPKLDSGHAYYQRPIFVGIVSENASASNCLLSVQKLAVSPPQFAIAVS